MSSPNRRRRPWSIALWGVIAILALSLPVLGPNLITIASSRAFEYPSVDAVPTRPVAIVFGGDVNPDGTPAPTLAARIDAGMALYRAHKADLVLFSGDDGHYMRDETGAMARYARAHGLSPKAFAIDGKGLDTYDTPATAPRTSTRYARRCW